MRTLPITICDNYSKYKFVFLFVSLFYLCGCSATNMIFSNAEYETSILIKSYLLDDNKLHSFFEGDHDQFELIDGYPVAGNRYYYVVRVKNKGGKGAWGELSFRIDNKEFASVKIPVLGPYAGEYICLIPVSMYGGILDKSRITTKWSKLYSK